MSTLLQRSSRGLACLLLIGCGDQPAPRSAYEGEALAVLSEGCDPARLQDGDEQACVYIERVAAGEGPAAGDGDWVRIHYIALVSDTEAGADPTPRELDSSHGGKPLALKLGESSEVIAGMHIGVRGMQVGERRRLRVPPRLGYEGRKLPGVPPKATLIFLIEATNIRGAGSGN